MLKSDVGLAAYPAAIKKIKGTSWEKILFPRGIGPDDEDPLSVITPMGESNSETSRLMEQNSEPQEVRHLTKKIRELEKQIITTRILEKRTAMMRELQETYQEIHKLKCQKDEGEFN